MTSFPRLLRFFAAIISSAVQASGARADDALDALPIRTEAAVPGREVEAEFLRFRPGWILALPCRTWRRASNIAASLRVDSLLSL